MRHTNQPTESSAILLNLIILSVTVVIFAGVLEISLRFMYARSLDFSVEMWKYAVTLKQPVSDSKLSFVHVPNRSAFLMGVPVSIDSLGFRDREYSQTKPVGTYRIVILGDSTTFGWGVPVEQTVAKILERNLNRNSGSRFEVINAGVGNYGTVQEVEQYLTHDRALHPDLVILEYFINDPEPVPRERRAGILGRSYLFAFSISRFDGLMRLIGVRPRWQQYYTSLYADDQPGLIAAKAALKNLSQATRVDNTLLLVALLPELHVINGRYPFATEHKKITNLLDDINVPSIELIDALRGRGSESELWITPSDTHPNGKANELIALQMERWVKQNIR